MSDLISRSALIKHLTDWRLQESPIGVCEEETETYKTICECIEAVKEQPTAYDVDAVVDELVKDNICRGRLEGYIPKYKAIEIVKAGGKV